MTLLALASLSQILEGSAHLGRSPAVARPRREVRVRVQTAEKKTQGVPVEVADRHFAGLKLLPPGE